MDDSVFALLDDIGETARGGDHRDGVFPTFDEYQVLENEPRTQMEERYLGTSESITYV
jgi:hypothetical protein